jgi:hypothetical protein
MIRMLCCLLFVGLCAVQARAAPLEEVSTPPPDVTVGVEVSSGAPIAACPWRPPAKVEVAVGAGCGCGRACAPKASAQGKHVRKEKCRSKSRSKTRCKRR